MLKGINYPGPSLGRTRTYYKYENRVGSTGSITVRRLRARSAADRTMAGPTSTCLAFFHVITRPYVFYPGKRASRPSLGRARGVLRFSVREVSKRRKGNSIASIGKGPFHGRVCIREYFLPSSVSRLFNTRKWDVKSFFLISQHSTDVCTSVFFVFGKRKFSANIKNYIAKLLTANLQ